MEKITDETISELLRTKSDGSLYHREAKDLEFKESFNLAGIGEYLKDFAGFGNNQGGYLIFGVTNSPRKLKGLTKRSKDQFTSIDEEKISGFINEYFSPYIDWECGTYKVGDKFFGVFYISQSNQKPVICKKDNSDLLRNGYIYYRYAGRTQVVEFAELSQIIENRIQENNNLWVQKVKSIGEAGPSNVGILDTRRGVIESSGGALFLDEDLIEKIKFIKEGQFNQKEGAKTLKLIGNISSLKKVEVEKIIKQRLIDEYPFSYHNLEKEIKKIFPKIKVNRIQGIIKENELKLNSAYSAFNFRNKDQQNEYEKTKYVPKGTTSLYNQKAVDFIIKIIKNESI